jgi:hypothetical protein
MFHIDIFNQEHNLELDKVMTSILCIARVYARE